jgi:CBS domain-containing protein
MLRKDAIEFLKTFPASRALDNASLRELVNHLVIKFFPSGTLILKQHEPSAQVFHMIKKGGVMIYVQTETGERRIIDYRGEGDIFGSASLTGNHVQSVSARAIEDTVCYVVGKPDLLKLLENAPAIAEIFKESHSRIYRHVAYGELPRETLVYGEAEKLLFTTPVRQLLAKGVVTAGRDVSIAEAARRMALNHMSFLLITDENDEPVGIITDTDLRNKVLAQSKSPEDPVRTIMSSDLFAINGTDFCFEALLKMIDNNIHHLIVFESRRLMGVLSLHDLMMLYGISPLIFIKDIERQETIDGLVSVSRKIISLIALLLREGAKASNITRIVTEVNDHLERRILDIALKTFGPSPTPFCWIIYGSEGRKEQTFKTDQDNAIIYADAGNDKEADAAEEYFSRFAAFVVDGLLQCGFARCSGNYMATNPRWRKPLSVWKRYFSEWIYEPTPDAVIFSVILFDFRGLYGDFRLASELKQHLMQSLRGQKIFLKYIADMTSQVAPPLSFFRTFRVEDEGEHKNMLDIKKTCIAPMLNIVRLFSLESGIQETSTLERIAALKSVHTAVRRIGDELEQAFEFLSLLRIRHQFEQISTNLQPDNFINPDRLSVQEKNTLREVCQFISRVLDGINREYNPGVKM